MTDLVDRAIAALRSNHDTLVTLVPSLSDDQLDRPERRLGVDDRAGALAPGQRRRDQCEADRGRGRHPGRGRGQPGDLGAVGRRRAGRPGGRLRRARHRVPRHRRGALGRAARERHASTWASCPSRCRWSWRSGCGSTRSRRTPGTSGSAWTPTPASTRTRPRSLLELYAGPLGFLLGFAAKPDQLAEEARLAIPGGGIVVADQVTVTSELTDPTATFAGSPEAVARLLTGRLTPEHTPADVQVTGNVTLDDLRKVFPGY